MSRVIRTGYDPLDTGYQIYQNAEVEFMPGLTVLIGCNGSGKTTMLQTLRYIFRNDNTPFISFDNLRNGGNHSRQEALFRGNLDFLATSVCSSEGESIYLNLSEYAKDIGLFMQQYKSSERDIWILMDAVDSGFSIDNIIALKRFLKDMVLKDEHHKNTELYIVVSANSFEMANGEQCLDVYTGDYCSFFDDYSAYREFILEGVKRKEKRKKLRKNKSKSDKNSQSTLIKEEKAQRSLIDDLAEQISTLQTNQTEDNVHVPRYRSFPLDDMRD